MFLDFIVIFIFNLLVVTINFAHIPNGISQQARRSYHGSPPLSDKGFNAAVADELHGYECRRIHIEVANYNGGKSISSPHENLKPNQFTPSYESQTVKFLPNLVIAEARHALFNLLEELQEGLVVKLLLPTEPTTPSIMSDVLGLRGTSMSDCRLNLESIVEVDCWQETRPLLQRFKNLYMCNEANQLYENIKSPDSVMHFSDTANSLDQSFINNFYGVTKIDLNYDLSTKFDARYIVQPRVAVFPHMFDQDSNFGNSLQPISPICSREDVTSVQLLHLRVHLDPCLESNQRKLGFDTKSCRISLHVDYAIKIPASQKVLSKCENDQGEESFTLGTASIASVPYMPRTTLLSPQSNFLPLMTIDTFAEYPLTATITTTSLLESKINPVKFDFLISLDYEFILSELMQLISMELRKIPVS